MSIEKCKHGFEYDTEDYDHKCSPECVHTYCAECMVEALKSGQLLSGYYGKAGE